MGKEKEIEEQVKQAIAEPSETAPEKESEEAPSGEVKPTETDKTEKSPDSEKESEEKEVVTEPVEEVDKKDKVNEQLKNLNIALSEERKEKKELREQIDSIKPFYDKMKSALVPEEESTPEEKTEEERFNEWYAQKQKDREEESTAKKLQEDITKQIDSLGKEWDGKDGKPKYDDTEVYEWQQKNGKTYLMPEDAFLLMKKDDIIDWKSKQNISKSKTTPSAEKPSGISSEHVPAKNELKTDSEIKKAVFEALSSSEE